MKAAERTRAFSLVELVIVVVILGILAAIAVPRISKGAKGADESALRADLAALRNAIDLYSAEHSGDYPGAKAAGGTFGAAGSEDALKNQLSKYTSIAGVVSETKTAVYEFGPYLRRPMPPLPVGTNRGKTGVDVANTGPAPDGTGDFGWVYNYATGEIVANCADGETDAATTKYNSY